MHKSKIIIIGLIFVVFAVMKVAAQDYYSPMVNYSFNSSTVTDESGNSELYLRNNTALFDDAERGKVLRFIASDKGYAVFNKQMLNSDSSTISFFFYWEDSQAGLWHQLFELHNNQTNSNLFFTPENGWGDNECSLISDSKEYSTYESVSAQPLQKNRWMHLAVTFEDKLISIYIDGQLASKGYSMFTPSTIKADSLFLGGNPYRSDYYYITARMDDIKIFNHTLTANQILSLSTGAGIPAPEDAETVWETFEAPLHLTIDIKDKKQTIQNFGASDGWNTERIGKYWPLDKKEKLAELLFCTEKDEAGNPKGIGLSAWRFNIGSGTAEQGEASRISNESRRTEGFLNSDGSTYNWAKQQGQQWFLEKAALQYNVHHLIGWQNSPPVAFTTNNLGFREYQAPMSSILEYEYFDDFGRFLADVVEHFDTGGIHFDYISPLNEPQYSWSPDSFGGTTGQEGSPWTNQEIYDVLTAIDSEFSERSLGTKLFITEAGSISSLLRGSGHADMQLMKFWNPASSLSLVGQSSFANIVSFHSYWNDYGTPLVEERQELYSKAHILNPSLELWQTEYSLLGTGYREGFPASEKLSEMDCALSLARVVSADLNITNTSGWQWWTTFEKGKHGNESRFCLIEAYTRDDNTDGEFHLNKLFYTFGNFSHFIRPGMTRVGTIRSDNLTLLEENSDVIISVYTNNEEDKMALLATNMTDQAREINMSIKNTLNDPFSNYSLYLTDDYSNLELQDIDLSSGKFIVPARSVVTLTTDLDIELSVSEKHVESKFTAYYNSQNNEIEAIFGSDQNQQEISILSSTGHTLLIKKVENGQNRVIIPASHLPDGIYIVAAIGKEFRKAAMVVVTKNMSIH